MNNIYFIYFIYLFINLFINFWEYYLVSQI